MIVIPEEKRAPLYAVRACVRAHKSFELVRSERMQLTCQGISGETATLCDSLPS